MLCTGVVEKLQQAIEQAVTEFRKDRDDERLTFRDRHDRLRELYRLAERGDATKLRKKIERLPPQLLDYIERRARQILPKLNQPWPAAEARFQRLIDQEAVASHGEIFRQWVRGADDEMLVRAVLPIVAEGFYTVSGRKRPGGKQSRPHIEPFIRGVARGVPASSKHGGRPSDAPQNLMLIGRLAFAWEKATSGFPQFGRSDTKPFADLVHGIFQWIKEPGVENALRQYKKALKDAAEEARQRDAN